MVEDPKEEYLKAREERDFERMAALIKQGLPMTVIMEGYYNAFKNAFDFAQDYDNYSLIDALLSRTDIQDAVQEELIFKVCESLKILQYLEDHGVDIGRVCLNSKYYILGRVLQTYGMILNPLDEEQCQELCEIIEFFKSRGGGYCPGIQNPDRRL